MSRRVAVVGLLSWAAIVAYAIPTQAGPDALERAVRARRESETTSNLADFMLMPGNFGPTVEALGLSQHFREESEMDLELFDTSSTEGDQAKQLFRIFAPVVKPPANYFFNLLQFRKMRPILALLPPLRVLNDAKMQFQQYAGKQGLLDAKLLQSRMKKMGLDVSEGQSGAMVARMKTTSGKDHFYTKHNVIDQCDFVTSILRERGVLTNDQIQSADRTFNDVLVLKAKELDKYDSEFEIVPYDVWLDTDKAKHLFAFPSELPVYDDERVRGRVNEAIAILYDLVDDTTESNPDRMMNRCEHRILDAFSTVNLERDEQEIEYSPPRYETNRVAAWLNENYGNITHLRRTCKPSQEKGKDSCGSVYFNNDEPNNCATFKEYERGSVDCRLGHSLIGSSREITMTDLEGKQTSYSPLSKGIDSLYYIHDDNDDRMLSETEFRNLLQTLSIFGELSYRSTVDNPDGPRTSSGRPYFHLWYLAKGRRYNHNLLKGVAKLGQNRLQSQAFKEFWKAIHFPEKDRHWQRFTSLVDGPVNSLDLQGLYNRLGVTSNIVQGIIREWHDPSKPCNLESLTATDRAAVASLLDLNAGGKSLSDPEAIDALQNDMCQRVYGNKHYTCQCNGDKDCEDPRDPVTQYSTTQRIRYFSCAMSTGEEATGTEKEESGTTDLERNVGEIVEFNAMEYLDSVLLGMPSFSSNVPSSEYKHLLRMLHGSNDNFDEVTPERWQILAQVLRSFDLLDTNHSGNITPDEFQSFGRCTSRVMPRFRIPSSATMQSFFDKVLHTSRVMASFDDLYKDTHKSLPNALSLSEYAMLFSDLPSELCILKYCSSAGVSLSMKDVCLGQERAGVTSFCLMNWVDTHSDSSETGDDRKIYKDDLAAEDQCDEVQNWSSKPDVLRKYQEQVQERFKNRGLDKLVCKPMGILSFDSYLDPGFSAEVRGSLETSRINRCTLEQSCRDAKDKPMFTAKMGKLALKAIALANAKSTVKPECENL